MHLLPFLALLRVRNALEAADHKLDRLEVHLDALPVFPPASCFAALCLTRNGLEVARARVDRITLNVFGAALFATFAGLRGVPC
jgi:hypothetical protein